MGEEIYSFEKNIPKECHVEDGGKIKITSKHFKLGEHSLQWNWESASKFVFIPNYDKSTATGMSWWVYNEEPIDRLIHFNLYKNDKCIASFDYNIDFKGWRSFWYHFSRDGGIKVADYPDKVEIVAPDNENGGSLFFDCVRFDDKVTWQGMNDFHIKCVRQSKSLRDYVGIYNVKPFISMHNPTESELESITLIAERWEDWLLCSTSYNQNNYLEKKYTVISKYIENCKKEFVKYNIYRDKDGNVIGKGLFNANAGISPSFHDIFQNVILGLALDYRYSGDKLSKLRAFELLDYIYDQGWAEGSSMGSNCFEILRFEGYCHALLLLRKEMQKEFSKERYEQELRSLYWNALCGKMFQTDIPLGENADDLRATSVGMLVYILLLQDSSMQIEYLKAFKNYLENAYALTRSLFGTIKIDGSGFHHNFVYNTQYATEALYQGALYYFLFRNTPFALSDNVYNNLKLALTKLYNQAYFCDVPGSTGGRFPEGEGTLASLVPAFAYMALSKPDDDEMVGMAKRICDLDNYYITRIHVEQFTSRITLQNTPGALRAMYEVKKLQTQEAKEPQISEFLPYSGLLISRNDGWLVTIKGFSKYVVDYECIGLDGSTTRYMSNGHQQISNESLSLKSYTPTKSWDWTMFPGTTSKELPLNKLKFQRGQTKERNFSDEYFLGGVAFSDKYSMISNNLHDNANDTTFRARKSTFIFDNVLVNLGTNICNKDTSFNTHTTLFQDVQSSNIPTVNGVEVKNKYSNLLNDSILLIKNNWGNYYLVYPYGDSQFELERRIQKGVTHNLKPTIATYYDVARINHGKAPENKGYRYFSLLGKTKALVDSIANGSYGMEVLRQDSIAHIVCSKKDKIVAFSIFNGNALINDRVIISTERPIVGMYNYDNGANKIEMVISDPELTIPDIETNKVTPKMAGLRLRGRYQLLSDDPNVKVKYDNDDTFLRILCVDGKSYRFCLKKS